MNRVKLTVTMQLLSDTILGSGYSIPGGEDIAVCKDAAGYPYMKGSTFKGLLRESLENWLDWTGKKKACLSQIMGEEGREVADECRRIHITALTLQDKPTLSDMCYSFRTFTSIEDGIVKEGTLRSAACIRRGLVFCGEIECAAEDTALLCNAVRAIKYVGTMRSRGFGKVSFICKETETQKKEIALKATNVIRYRLHTEAPLLLREKEKSHENYLETKGYIPGSAVRGMVMGLLSQKDAAWFAEQKETLLRAGVRFTDALPVKNDMPVLPSMKGFYENKAETEFMSVLENGDITPGYKRANLGTFCSLEEKKEEEDNIIHYWSAETGAAMRIHRSDKKIFQTRYLTEGQTFEGYILLDDETLAPHIADVFSETVWIGADRYEGFGKCRVTELEATEELKYTAAYGYNKGDKIRNTLYLLAVSPFTMLNEMGEPCGLYEAELAKLLGVNTVEIEHCSTSTTEHSTYNSTWQCYSSAVMMYESGSMFKLKCDEAPDFDAISRVQREGIGIRREEGCGSVLFLRAELFEGLKGKKAVKDKKQTVAESTLKREKCRWIMEQCEEEKWALSPSQLGTIQSLCESALAQKKGAEELYQFLKKNLEDRGAMHGARFRAIDAFVKRVMAEDLSFAKGETEKLRLLCEIFDFSRKGRS